MPAIDFWYSIGSTYSYLTVMRLERVAQETGVTFRWHPFNVRHVMTVQKNIPFKDKPEKAAYMWRDIERRAAGYGLHPKFPVNYPIPELVLANQIAVLGEQEGWVETYTRAAYRGWFEAGHRPGEEPNLTAALSAAGQEPARVIAEAQSERVTSMLEAVTELAMGKGIFGSPSFLVGDELFWGDDRLEDAVAWAKRSG